MENQPKLNSSKEVIAFFWPNVSLTVSVLKARHAP